MNTRSCTQARRHTTPPTIDDLLLQARSGLARLDPVLALRAVHDGAILGAGRPAGAPGTRKRAELLGSQHDRDDLHLQESGPG